MKSVLITGAYGGMGCAAVKHFKEKGYRVFALDVKVGAPEENVFPIRADITSEESVACAYERVASMTDELFAIVHFAGIYMLDSLVEIEDESFRRIFDVNVRGAVLINRIFLPLLRTGSRILITTSELATLDPLPFTGIYAVTKAALDKYAYSLCMELQLLGIGVSVLRAGAVETGMLGASMTALERFCSKTELYSCSAKRFKSIVESVESKSVPASRVADKCFKIVSKKKPKFAYSINRNFLLCLLNILPKGLQFFIIRKILK